MATMLYYGDEDFERYMAHSEKNSKIQFYVCLVCSLIVQPCMWYVLLTDLFDGFGYWFLMGCSIITAVCLIGLWWCYHSVKCGRKNLQLLKKKRQEEIYTSLDSVEEERQKKLNQV